MTTLLQKRFKQLRGWLKAALVGMAAGTLLPVGCEQVTCPLNNTVEASYAFYASLRASDGTISEEAPTIALADTLTVTILGRDEVVLNRLYGQASMVLPVSYYSDVDSLLLRFADAAGAVGYDTLFISKHSYTHFDDPSCPVHMWHSILSVESTQHLIDTVVVVDPSITYDSGTNFAVYFRTE